MNSFLNPYNIVPLTNLVEIYAHRISLINIDEDTNEQSIDNILDLFLLYDNRSVVKDKIIDIGGGLSYTLKEFVGDIVDTQVPRLKSISEYIHFNYRKIDDEGIISNYYTFNKTYHIQNADDSVIRHSHKSITINNSVKKSLYINNEDYTYTSIKQVLFSHHYQLYVTNVYKKNIIFNNARLYV